MGLMPLVIARLRETGYQVWDSDVPDNAKPTYPHLVVGEDAPTPRRTPMTLAGTDDHQSVLVGIMSVGLTPNAVREIAVRARGLLTEWAPGPDGGHFWHAPQHKPHYGRMIVRDKDTPPVNGRPVYWGSDFYEFFSTPK